jgi:muconolactone delta-isomerase
MQFMAIVRRRTEAFSDAQFQEHLDAEASAVRRLYARGIVRQAWSRTDSPGGILLLEADSMEEAQRSLQCLPLVSLGMSETQLLSLKGYRGFGAEQ